MKKMNEQSRHIKWKVVLGYLLLALIFIGSIFYISKTLQRIEEAYPLEKSRDRVYLVTKTLSLLYESEALGRMIERPEGELKLFNEALDGVLSNLDTLRMSVPEALLPKIDTIEVLIEQKRYNTELLLETWQEINSGNLYKRNIEKVIAQQVKDTLHKAESKKQIVSRQDSLRSLTTKKKRNLFKRLADAFSPDKEDTTLTVNITRLIKSDSIAQAYNPSDTIVSVLKNLQNSLTGQRQQLITRLVDQSSRLHYNNTVITNRINQILRGIEEEEMTKSLQYIQKRQDILKENSYIIAGIAVLSLLIIILFIVLIIRDVSRSQLYRQQLEKAKQYAEGLVVKRERLMLTISHDIRAPLASIIGYIELSIRRKPDDRLHYYLENMNASANHVLDLVNGLLDFHRLESGKMEIQQIPFDIRSLFRSIYDCFRPIAANKGLQFLLDLKDADMEQLYMGDPIRLRQVVGNLLSNAIKFTNEGHIWLIIRLIGKDRLEIKVCDSGAGIPQAEQERIFCEFTRLPNTEKEEGFGLGLSITRMLIERMDGTLSLQSTVGKGSDFIINLPLHPSDTQQLPVTSDSDEKDTPELFVRKEIACLLVDDDPLQLALTEEFLKRNRIRVVTCTNPSVVVDLLKHSLFDVIITDIQMPEMNGDALLSAIRKSGIPGTEKVPVVALSASLENGQEHYLDLGFTGFLNKPFSAKQLIVLLNQLLSTEMEDRTSNIVDFSPLTAFAGEDKGASESIIKTFTEETDKNRQLLQQLLDEEDRAQAAKVAHKMIPLFSMLGAVDLVSQLRVLEKNEASLTDDGWKRILSEILIRTQEIAQQAKERLDAYSKI